MSASIGPLNVYGLENGALVKVRPCASEARLSFSQTGNGSLISVGIPAVHCHVEREQVPVAVTVGSSAALGEAAGLVDRVPPPRALRYHLWPTVPVAGYCASWYQRSAPRR